MRMTENADVRSGVIEKRSSLFSQISSFKYHMPDSDAEAVQMDDGLPREAALFVFIDIA
jgi:hypothetical protein